MLAPNTILQNRYRIVRELGHGGMGYVYEAVDQRVNCVVALKETTAGNDGEAKRAFEREASLLANLRHSTLPKVMDYFTEGDGDFLVMEFIPGYDLAELLDSRESPFPQSQVLRWAFELLRVMEYLHKQEPPILHRDIKPSNLKLTKTGEIFLLDFGLAKGALGQMPTLAASRSMRGYTPIYASLEQIHGHGTDPRSDLYSLAATLYHLLSGIPPVDAPTRFHVVEDGDPDPLRPIHEVNPNATASVAGVIHQAMMLRRKDRPISAAEMSRALRNAAEEDERNAAEEEYRRAEERRRLRVEQAPRAAPAANESEKKPRPPSAEPRHKKPSAPTASTAQQPRAAAQPLAPVAEPRAPALPPTVVAPTERPANPKRESEPAKPAISTVVSPELEPVRSAPSTNRIFSSLTPPAPVSRSYVGIIIAAVFVVAFFVGLIAWSMSGATENTNAVSAENQTSSSTRTTNAPVAPPGMAYVPGGTFTMGRDDGDEYERPAHSVTVKPFFIDVNEVTRQQYQEFVNKTGHTAPANWAGKQFPVGTANLPVTDVTWDDANAYAKWAGKRLPTEEEWEFAARGTDGRRYPWGGDWKSGNANADGASNSVQSVGSFKGASPYGETDMVGNAWEWTASKLIAYTGGELSKPPSSDWRVIRGGSYADSRDEATATYRRGYPARGNYDYQNTGFRCAKDIN